MAQTSEILRGSGRLFCLLGCGQRVVITDMAGAEAVLTTCEDCRNVCLFPVTPWTVERVAEIFGKQVPDGYTVDHTPHEGETGLCR